MARAYYPTSEGKYIAWTPDMVGAAPESHCHTYLSSLDTRTDNPLPSQIKIPCPGSRVGARLDFKQNSRINLEETGSNPYSQLITIIPWSDNSGGNIHQWALGTSSDLHPKISLRSGNQDTDTWGNWYEFYTSSRPEVVVSSSQPTNSNAKIWVKI